MRKTPTEWNKYLMRVYKQLKSKNPNVTLREAMKIASRRYR